MLSSVSSVSPIKPVLSADDHACVEIALNTSVKYILLDRISIINCLCAVRLDSSVHTNGVIIRSSFLCKRLLIAALPWPDWFLTKLVPTTLKYMFDEPRCS